MITTRFPAMGTTFEIVTRDPAGVERTRAFIETEEQRMSRFRLDSELSRVNATPPGRVVVSSEMAHILHLAVDLRDRTDGMVDVGCGAGVIAWGYDRSFGPGLDLDHRPEPAEAADWSIRGRVVNRSEGTTFDLGGLGKGWTADRVVESGLADVVSAGGDVRSGRADTSVTVMDPWGQQVARLVLGQGGLATSSTSRRTWRVASESVHHILNPVTGTPAQTPILSATALAGTAAEAEAAAKAVLILGVDGLSWAARQSWVRAALAVWEDGNVFATSGLEIAA